MAGMGYVSASGERRWQPTLQEGSTAEQAVQEARKALRDTVAEEEAAAASSVHRHHRGRVEAAAH